MSSSLTTAHETLAAPVRIGPTEIPNRVVLAPMTRVSATAEGSATNRMVAYYGGFARGGFGLLITEGTYIDTEYSQGYLNQPGIANAEQAEAWKPVVEAAHQGGALIFAQLMHAGSQSQGNRFTDVTVGPSAIRPKGEQLGIYRGVGPYRVPQEITPAEIEDARASFVRAALYAQEAGFDGVEIHGANGYLIDEFLTDYLNARTDGYGGSCENRVRLAAEVCRDIRAAVRPDFVVGIRISQSKVSDADHRWRDGTDDAKTIFETLGATGIDYIHTTEYRAADPAFVGGVDSLAALAKRHSGVVVIANGNLDDPEAGAELVRSGQADAVALGKSALTNRDWPNRVRDGQSLGTELDFALLTPIADIKDSELT